MGVGSIARCIDCGESVEHIWTPHASGNFKSLEPAPHDCSPDAAHKAAMKLNQELVDAGGFGEWYSEIDPDHVVIIAEAMRKFADRATANA